MKIDNLINYFPYEFSKKKKTDYFVNRIKELTDLHKDKCKEYEKILNIIYTKNFKNKNLTDFPFLPTQLFKRFDLKSTHENMVVKKITSSGTSGKALSKIYLDKENANNQIKVLSKIMSTIFGNKRLPMLIVDKELSLKSRNTFNARVAAIQGFSIFGTDHTYLLDENNKINYSILNNFLGKFSKKPFIIFGFTSSIYENLIKNLSINSVQKELHNGILLHGGGWKKLEKLKISNKKFKQELNKKLKIRNIYNYYGLVEQTGSLFVESKKCGYFHTTIYSEIIIRDEKFNVLKNGKKGLIQLLSLLPTSYPGHNILTEDIGVIVGEDDCKCGLKGKYFLVHGRAKNSETRGCGNI